MTKALAVVIASGGASTRLGEFKPLASLKGRPLISYALDFASKVSSRVYLLLNNRAQYDSMKEAVRNSRATVIFDSGALPFPASLVRSMGQVEEEVLFLIGCDTPFLDSRLPRLLLPRLGASGAVIPLWPNGYVEPMTALYLKSRLPLGRVFSSMKMLASAMNASFVKIGDLGISPDSFMNINSPSDLRAANARLLSLTDYNTSCDEPYQRKHVPIDINLPAPALA